MSIRGVTFDYQTITAKDDGAKMRAIYGYKDGMLWGGEVSIAGLSGVRIEAGGLLICGRLVIFEQAVIVPTQAVDDGSNRAAIIYRIDLTKEPLPNEFTQGEIKIVGRKHPTQGEPSLTKEDINADGNVYEVLLAYVKLDEGRHPIELVVDTDLKPFGLEDISISNTIEKNIALKGGEIEETVNDAIADLAAYIGYTAPDILGVEVDFANNRFTRLAGAVGLEAGADFDQFPMYQRRRCNLTDNGLITAYYGDEGYTETGYAQSQIIIPNPYGTGMDVVLPAGTQVQVMVEQKPFWYKIVPLEAEPAFKGQLSGKKVRYYISATPKVGFELHPAFDNRPNPIYLSAYECCLFNQSLNDGAGDYETTLIEETDVDLNNDKLSSISGGLLLKHHRGNMLYEHWDGNFGYGYKRMLRNGNWHLSDIYTLSISQILFLVEYASFNAQERIGGGITGNVVGNRTAKTGATSVLGNQTGTAAVDDGLIEGMAVSYRGEENLWGNAWQYTGYGIDTENKLNRLPSDGAAGIEMNPLEYFAPKNEGFISSFFVQPIGIRTRSEPKLVFLPIGVDGDSANPVGDYYDAYSATTHRALLAGGAVRTFDYAGLFACKAVDIDGVANISARMLYVPGPVTDDGMAGEIL